LQVYFNEAASFSLSSVAVIVGAITGFSEGFWTADSKTTGKGFSKFFKDLKTNLRQYEKKSSN
jgi:hypothetical protein